MQPGGIAVVSRRGEGRVQRGHPWVFRSDVTRVEDAAPGSVVQVLAASGRPLGFAFFSSRSEITLRSARVPSDERSATAESSSHDRLRSEGSPTRPPNAWLVAWT